MIAMLALASADPGAHALLGNRLQADGKGLGAAISEDWVAGGDGGTLATTAIARWGGENAVVAVRLPFASYRTPAGRTTNLGNLRVDASWRRGRGAGVTLLGVSTHLRLGRAYTWTNDAGSIWPGTGIDAVVQHRQGDRTAWIARAALGIHNSEGYAPFPEVYGHVSGAVGIDQQIGEPLGITFEASASWWDPSPIDLATYLRADPTEGMRLRLGLLLPVGTWAGLSPSEKAPGVREATVSAALSFSL